MGYKPSEKPKQKYKKGLWSPDEDLKLKNHIIKYGHGCWTSIPINAGLQRNGKSCRLRWINYLRPGLKRGAFSLEEETILTLHRVLGNKWSQISHHLPGRTDNEIKNHWHAYLKKRVSKMAEEVDGKSKKFHGLKEISPPSFKLTRQNSGFESLDNTEASLTDTDQSMQLSEQKREDQICNLPKILFAEWLSLDRFNGQNQGCSRVAADSRFTFDYGTAISEDSSVQGHQLNEKLIGNEMHNKSNLFSMNGIVHSPFGLGDQISESGLIDYFPGEFDIYCDDLYM